VPQLHPQQAPPPDYYAGNLRHLLADVASRNADLLGDAERALIVAFQGVGVEAQRLFARLVSRSGPWIRVDSLRYREIACLDAALSELARAGLVVREPDAPAEALLQRLTRAEGSALFPAVRAPRKAAWIAACVARYPDTWIRARIARRHGWVALADRRAFHACLVLFFGGDGQDLSTFVMQDLGLLRFEPYPLDAATRAFRDRAELTRYLLCRRLSAWSHDLDGQASLAALLGAALWGCTGSRPVVRARDRVLNRLGQWHERRGELDAALCCYGRSTLHPARERRARLLRRLGDEAGVQSLLEAMRDDPWAPDEQDFAERFGTRGRAHVPPTSTCELTGAPAARIEQHALNLLTADGGRGWHLENLLPLGLAGLAYWDVVFAPVAGAFSHPFQLGPQDLFWPDFARARRGALEARSAALRQPGALAAQLRATAASRRGVANRLVHWEAFDDELLDALLGAVPHAVLAELASYTIGNLHRARTGFPDLLLIYAGGAWEVIEVKSPNDQLQPAQRVWLKVLAQLGVPARVLRFRAAR
jgi:hypothetical protein